MPRKINQFRNGVSIEYDSGKFDDWCVYLTRANGKRIAPSDNWYFKRLKKLAEKHGSQKIYDDFVVIFNRTAKQIETDVLDLIALLSRAYSSDEPEMEIWLNVLYAGMVAEENKEHAKLGKRIKRLGVHQVLIENAPPEKAAVFSKGKKWGELDKLMKLKGF